VLNRVGYSQIVGKYMRGGGREENPTKLNHLRHRIRKVFSSSTGPDTGQFIFRSFLQFLIG